VKLDLKTFQWNIEKIQKNAKKKTI